MISFSQALLTLNNISSLTQHEVLPVGSDLVGRFLVRDIIAASDLPRFSSSGMDGYLLFREAHVGDSLQIRGQIFAGVPWSGSSIKVGETLYIATGGLVPDWGHTVIPVEKVTQDDANTIIIKEEVPANANIRPAGEDYHMGDLLLAQGTQVSHGSLALLYGSGIESATVAARPRLAIVASGDEIVATGEQPGRGQVFDVNRRWLTHWLREWYEVTGSLVVGDQFDTLLAALRQASQQVDVLVLSGGMSVGKKDHTRNALEALGCRIHFYKVAQKPGKPILFGTLPDGTVVLGLPGNPAAALAGATIYLRIIAWKLAGAPVRAQSFQLSRTIKNGSSRTWLLWGSLDSQGKFTPDKIQNSHLLGPLSRASFLAIVPPGIHEASTPVETYHL